MLNIQHFKVNFIEENCYVVSDETREAVIIDCGAFFPEEKAAISSYLSENKLVLRHLLCTHGHFDHVFGAQFISDTYLKGAISFTRSPPFRQIMPLGRALLDFPVMFFFTSL